MLAEIFAKTSGLTPVFGVIAAVLLVVGIVAVALSKDPKSKQ